MPIPKGKTYEEIYGTEEAARQRNLRVENMKRIHQENPDRATSLSIRKKGQPMSMESRKKLSKTKGQSSWSTYRKRALVHYGRTCARCNFQSEKDSDFDVHHKDMNSFPGETGNHALENLQVLCGTCHAKFHKELSGLHARFVGLPHIERGVHFLLKGLQQEYGLDLSDVNFKDTPKRVARAWAEIFEGVKNTKAQVAEILSSAFPCENKDLVIARGIHACGMCPHHLLPVEYSIDIGYIPNGTAVGISKLTRLVEVLAARPVLQETLAEELTDILVTKLGSPGAMVVTNGRHFCMIMRGVKSEKGLTTVSSVAGVFRENAALRQEFLGLTKP